MSTENARTSGRSPANQRDRRQHDHEHGGGCGPEKFGFGSGVANLPRATLRLAIGRMPVDPNPDQAERRCQVQADQENHPPRHQRRRSRGSTRLSQRFLWTRGLGMRSQEDGGRSSSDAGGSPPGSVRGGGGDDCGASDISAGALTIRSAVTSRFSPFLPPLERGCQGIGHR
jgi:hypothetical protein